MGGGGIEGRWLKLMNSSYKINKCARDVMYNIINIINSYKS